ncbi:MAG TPA: TA system VapC family ribonuclease toxin [Terracidiphilus sp.]|nr:TA system VapC family ribonuclease toxin [Terracidiphilus sp.]
MIVVDVNLLIYAYDTTCPQHADARRWLEEIFSGTEPIGLPWQTISAFLRILTHPGVSGGRLSMAKAVSVVEDWLAVPHVQTLAAGRGHWAHLREMLLKSAARGNMTTDAALAALTLEHGGILYTNDRDFARFPGLRWVNPLETS